MKKSKKLLGLIGILLISLMTFRVDVYAACPLGPHVTKDLTNVLNIFKIVAPLLVIVVSTYEAVIAITKGDAQVELKKVFIRFCKRVGLAALIFFLPVLVDQVMQMMNVWDDEGGCKFENTPEIIEQPEEKPALEVPKYESLDPNRAFTLEYYGTKTCFTVDDYDDIIANLHADPEPANSTYKANPTCYDKDGKKIDCSDDALIGGRVEFTARDDRSGESLTYSFNIKDSCEGSQSKEAGANFKDLELVLENTSKTCFINNTTDRDTVHNNIHLIYKDPKDNKKFDLGNTYTAIQNGGVIEAQCYKMDGKGDFACNEPGWVEYTATYKGATVKQVVYFYKDLSDCGKGESAGKTTTVTTAKRPDKLTLTYWGNKTCFTNDDLGDLLDNISANQQARIEPFCYNAAGKSVNCSSNLTGGYIEVKATTETGLEDSMRFDVKDSCDGAETRIPPTSEELSFKIENPNGCFTTKDRTYIQNNLILYSGNTALGNADNAPLMGAKVDIQCYTTKDKADWGCNNKDGYMIFTAKYQNRTIDYRVDISSSCK